MVKLQRVVKVGALLLAGMAAAQACGPDFLPDVFVRTYRPDMPGQYGQGRLGLLQGGFPRADLFVAYRYLTGGTLDAEEQKGWALVQSEEPLNDNGDDASPEQPVTGLPTVKPLAQWVAARGLYADAPPGPIGQDASEKVKLASGYEYDLAYLNCGGDAFTTAVATLAARARVWGRGSAALAEWLRGQDAVFSNCGGLSDVGFVPPTKAGAVGVPARMPGAVSAGSPALLVWDRAYQMAAAEFYAAQFEQARAGFVAIGAENGSPWQAGAGYLAGRVLVRQAFLGRSGEEDPLKAFDPVKMAAAEQQLRAYLATGPGQPWRQAAEAELALVRIRLEPDVRAKELGTLVAGSAPVGATVGGLSGSKAGHDANYAQDLRDLLWVTDAKTPEGLRAQGQWYPGEQMPDAAHPGQMRDKTLDDAKVAADGAQLRAYLGSAGVRGDADAVDWAVTMQSLSPAAAQHAMEQWQKTRALPWMVAALVLAPSLAPSRGAGADGGASAAEAAADAALLRAAGGVGSGSPAWETVTYHRVRLLLATGRGAEARTVLAGFAAGLERLPAVELEPSTENAVRGLERLGAPTVQGFLAFVPQRMLAGLSEEDWSVNECQQVMQDPKRHYDCVARVDPEQMDAGAAAILNAQAPLGVWLEAAGAQSLPAQLRGAIAMEGWTRAALLGDTGAMSRFVPLLPERLRAQAAQTGGLGMWMTLARDPGLRPYVNGGTQRAYSYDFVESYRDNWCYVPTAAEGVVGDAAFLSAAERARGVAEARRLDPVRSVVVGQRIVREVQANPADARGPEALYLVLRMIRYGCAEAANAKPVQGEVDSQESKDLLGVKLEAGRLLRKYYRDSKWTKKAAPFVG